MSFFDGDNNWLWILVLCFCLFNDGFDFDDLFDGDNWWWIIIILFLLFND